MSTEQDASPSEDGGRELSPRCACGVPADTDPRFHKRSAVHDCEYHFRRRCGWCRTVERMLNGIEARLWVEVEHGPFVVTRRAA